MARTPWRRRSRAADLLEAGPGAGPGAGAAQDEAGQARAAREALVRAAEVVAAWVGRPEVAQALPPEQARWAARALFEGQRPAEATPLYARALAQPPGDDPEALRLRAEAERAVCLLSSDPRAAWEALVRVRDAVVIRDGAGRVVGLGTLIGRRLAGPFLTRHQGREVQQHVHLTTLRDAAGAERTFVDVAAPAGQERFHVVEGSRPPAGRVPADERWPPTCACSSSWAAATCRRRCARAWTRSAPPSPRVEV